MKIIDLLLAEGLGMLAALAVLVVPMALAWLLVRRGAGERPAPPSPPWRERRGR